MARIDRGRVIADRARRLRDVFQGTLLPEEQVLGEGRAAYLRPDERLYGGSTRTYLWVTDRRVVWCELWPRQVSLPLGLLVSYQERSSILTGTS